MRESCVSIVENRNRWWAGVFSVASKAEVLDRDEKCPPGARGVELFIDIRAHKFPSISSLSSNQQR